MLQRRIVCCRLVVQTQQVARCVWSGRNLVESENMQSTPVASTDALTDAVVRHGIEQENVRFMEADTAVRSYQNALNGGRGVNARMQACDHNFNELTTVTFTSAHCSDRFVLVVDSQGSVMYRIDDFEDVIWAALMDDNWGGVQ